MFCCVNIYLNERQENEILWRFSQNRERKMLSKLSFSFILYILNSQIKNAENKTSPTVIPSPDHVSSSSKPPSNNVPTHKPPTTTYKSLTTSYKSTSSTRSYNIYNQSDKLTEQERLRLREEFFATYDVMTGIRIAVTLGGFFFFMVFLIVYKSRSKSNKALRVSF